MPHLIYIFFSGLIVLVPQLNNTIKAYLVKDTPMVTPDGRVLCDHVPTLLISGDFKINHGSACRRVLPALLSCDLTDASLVQLTTENGQVSLPVSADKDLPIITDGGSAKWLVRMTDVDKPATKVRTDLSGRYEAEFDFGWNAANTCIFDEVIDPPTKKKMVVAIDFKDNNGVKLRRQAVAETVMFTSVVDDPVVLTINPGGKSPTEIALDCSSACPGLKFSNNVEQDQCPNVSHFEDYFDFSADQQHVTRAHTDRFTTEEIESSTVTSSCPGGGGVIQLLDDLTRAQLRHITERLTQPKPSDILICPPVVMEQ